ncbi:hypothetical protein Tco_0640845, partial [Tanacetum coccineum]
FEVGGDCLPSVGGVLPPLDEEGGGADGVIRVKGEGLTSFGQLVYAYSHDRHVLGVHPRGIFDKVSQNYARFE